MAGLLLTAAVVALIAPEPAAAQRFNMTSGPRFNVSAGPRVNMTTGPRVTGTDIGRKPTGDGVRPPRTGGRNPDGPNMPTGPRGPRYPGVGIATGVVIGTAIGAAAAAAAPPPGVVITDANDDPLPGQRRTARNSGNQGNRRAAFVVPPSSERRFVPDEVVLDIASSVPETTLAAMARQHRLTRLEAHTLGLTGRTLYRWRIADRRSVPAVIRSLAGDARIAGAQPNYLYALQQQAAAAPPQPDPAPQPDLAAQKDLAASAQDLATRGPADAVPAATAGDPAQYTIGKLRLADTHRMARGENVLVAVIDSGIDSAHPDLAGVVVASYDPSGNAEKPHSHGTGMAGAIASHGRLVGVAPAVRILAVRAFGASASGAEGTTFHILKGLDWALGRGARVVNMSFAGPADPGLGRALAAARQKGAVLIAAAGNAGPKSPPLYPAADPNVIAVTATDADDRVFTQANRGNHVSVAAPGVDILVPAPEAGYQISSGTSVATAHVSGVAALLVERSPGLGPDQIRRVLTASARDLGRKGVDPEFGAGLVSPYDAILSLGGGAAGRTSEAAPVAR